MKYYKIIKISLMIVLILALTLTIFSFYLKWRAEIPKQDMEVMPPYLRISFSNEIIPDKISSKYIIKVKNQKKKNGKPYNDELTSSYPSVPEDARRWECHLYEGKYYVCYVLRPMPGSCQVAYIWGIKNEYGKIDFYPYNSEATNLTYIDLGSDYNFDNIRSLSDKNREMIEFLMDRETWITRDAIYKKSIKIASKKFNIPEKDVIKILGSFNKQE